MVRRRTTTTTTTKSVLPRKERERRAREGDDRAGKKFQGIFASLFLSPSVSPLGLRHYANDTLVCYLGESAPFSYVPLAALMPILARNSRPPRGGRTEKCCPVIGPSVREHLLGFLRRSTFFARTYYAESLYQRLELEEPSIFVDDSRLTSDRAETARPMLERN